MLRWLLLFLVLVLVLVVMEGCGRGAGAGADAGGGGGAVAVAVVMVMVMVGVAGDLVLFRFISPLQSCVSSSSSGNSRGSSNCSTFEGTLPAHATPHANAVIAGPRIPPHSRTKAMSRLILLLLLHLLLRDHHRLSGFLEVTRGLSD